MIGLTDGFCTVPRAEAAALIMPAPMRGRRR